MALRKDFTRLKSYVKFLHAKTIPFACPHCGNSILPKDFEKHCTSAHGLITRLCCVWCFGKVSWPSKEKCLNAKHLMECSARFLNRNRNVQFNREPLCPEKNLFGRTCDPQPRIYEPVWPTPLPPIRMTFDIESLNTASSCLRTYLELWKTTYWVHVVVRSAAFQSFLEGMDADEGRTTTLPFSCLCDGGKGLEARYREHRHMIVVSPSREHFERNVWRKIKMAREDRPHRNYIIKHKEPIKNALHLVNILGYVSQRESMCKLSGEAIESANHYYIFESLPRSYRLCLVPQWKSGLVKLLHQEYKNLKLLDLVRAPMERGDDGKWRIRVKDIPGIQLGARLPVAADLHPCRHPTDCFLHLLNGKVIYFDRRPSSSSSEPPAVLLYDDVQQEPLTPRPYHQRIVNEFKPLVDRNRELESENASLREALNEARGASDAWKGEHEAAERQLVRANEEAAQLRGEAARLEGKHALEVAQLKAAAEKEAKDLLKNINKMHETEIARLKRENDECKMEIAKLKNENDGWKRKCNELKNENDEWKRKFNEPKRKNPKS